MTYSVLEKFVKIWRFGEDGCKCIGKYKHHNELIQFDYSKQVSSMAFLDVQGDVCVLQGDFEKTKEEAEQAVQ